jgi:hypothetical protein
MFSCLRLAVFLLSRENLSFGGSYFAPIAVKKLPKCFTYVLPLSKIGHLLKIKNP